MINIISSVKYCYSDMGCNSLFNWTSGRLKVELQGRFPAV